MLQFFIKRDIRVPVVNKFCQGFFSSKFSKTIALCSEKTIVLKVVVTHTVQEYDIWVPLSESSSTSK